MTSPNTLIGYGYRTVALPAAVAGRRRRRTANEPIPNGISQVSDKYLNGKLEINLFDFSTITHTCI